MKPVTRYTLATVTLLLTSCGQEEGKGTPADQGEQSAAVQAVTPSPAADTPAPQHEPEPEVEPAAESSDEPAVLPEPAPSPEPTPTPETDAPGEVEPEPTPAPETADPGESDPEPMPTPEAIDAAESNPEPTPAPEAIDPGESDPEPTAAPEAIDPGESDPEPTILSGGDLAPENLGDKTVVFNYESSQYKYSEDGEDVSGWQSYQNAKKNVKSCAEVFIIVGLNPEATRNILSPNTTANGDKYVYRKTGPNTGTLDVSRSNSDRTYTITFTSPTTGTATEEIFVGSMQGNVRNIRFVIPAPETADPVESDPEPTPDPETADPEESDPEPTTLAGGDLAPENLVGKTAVFNYESSQYKYSEDGENVSGWQSYQNAKKNVKSCAEAFIAVGLKPKATRNILPLNTPAKGGKYVYRKTGPNTGTIEVSSSNSARTYTITFTSPTTGTATEEIFVGGMQGNVRNIQVSIK